MNIKKLDYKLIIIILFILLIIVSVFSMLLGKYEVSVRDIILIFKNQIFNTNSNIDEMSKNVILGLRFPRVLAAIVVGAALSISGVCYQGIFNNPLVSPDFLGVSQGACIGAAIAILFSMSAVFINVFAFVGGIISVIITIFISKIIKYKSNINMVLSGIIVGTLMSSVLGFIKFIADPDTELASITYWTMGSFSYIDINVVIISVILVFICSIILYKISWKIDILATGEDEAKILGVNTNLVRRIVIICATILTATSICIAGTIGWVGLIIPHFSRILAGSANKKLIPISMLSGSIFMILVDTMTRTIGNIEMPVSILTGFIGAPCFLLLLYVKRSK